MRDSLAVLGQLLDGSDQGTVRLDEAAGLLDGLVLSDDFTVFLTLAAYPRLA
jgi:hypothetical protein